MGCQYMQVSALTVSDAFIAPSTKQTRSFHFNPHTLTLASGAASLQDQAQEHLLPHIPHPTCFCLSQQSCSHSPLLSALQQLLQQHLRAHVMNVNVNKSMNGNVNVNECQCMCVRGRLLCVRVLPCCKQNSVCKHTH